MRQKVHSWYRQSILQILLLDCVWIEWGCLRSQCLKLYKVPKITEQRIGSSPCCISSCKLTLENVELQDRKIFVEF